MKMQEESKTSDSEAKPNAKGSNSNAKRAGSRPPAAAYEKLGRQRNAQFTSGVLAERSR